MTSDGHGIALRHLVCDRHHGHWVLSKQYRIDDVAPSQTTAEIVHLSWENSRDLKVSRDFLAAVDAYGRTTVYGLIVVVTRLKATRAFVIDPVDDLSSVVGIKWLQNEKNLVSNIWSEVGGCS